jgi:hypothetical protein
MNPSLWISILSLTVSFATLVLTTWLYSRISQSQIDDNIINATDSILALLERAKTLNQRERRLLVAWLDDWEYFAPPRIFRKYRPIPREETIKNLKRYFDDMTADVK